MRQIGELGAEADARRFAAYLETLQISTATRLDGSVWGVWVREENDLSRARSELQQFLVEPEASQYRGAEAELEARSEAQQPANTQPSKTPSNTQPENAPAPTAAPRGVWQPPRINRCWITLGMIAISVSVAIVGGMGQDLGPVWTWLSFSEMRAVAGDRVAVPTNGWEQIQQGQIWRTITPIFLHSDVGHLVFNMATLYFFGGQVEDRWGRWRFLGLVLALATISNAVQYQFTGNPLFGGMSGVGYGLFGFVWMKSVYDRRSGLFASGLVVSLMMVFMVLCILREIPPLQDVLTPVIPPVANAAHVAGLTVGMVAGTLSGLAARHRRRQAAA